MYFQYIVQMVRDIKCAYSANHSKFTNILCDQNAELLIIKICVHIVTTEFKVLSA